MREPEVRTAKVPPGQTRGVAPSRAAAILSTALRVTISKVRAAGIVSTRPAQTSVFKPRVRDSFAEKGGLLILGLSQCYLQIRKQKLDGQAREASAAPEVQKCLSRRELSGSEQALAEMTTDDLFRVTDGGEIGMGVPLEEEIEVHR